MLKAKPAGLVLLEELDELARLTDKCLEQEETRPGKETNPASASTGTTMKAQKTLEAETLVETNQASASTGSIMKAQKTLEDETVAEPGKAKPMCTPHGFLDEAESSCFE